ncbi:hypothetical protein AN216_05595 [Streptomyces oceani]|uniref:RDD domain-containing protein n=1 Tax=Streptomyces oceani TaxID=1075402 RepID=A0A1E7KLM4_9ACTN|nr:hypothetical protein AN216_05595 [Streptomyces oceani]
MRGLLAGSVDALVTVIGGFTLATLLLREKTGPDYWLPAVGCLLAVSFVNHVLLTVPVRASLGKLLFNVRMIRMADGGRPHFWQAVRRWVAGFFYQPVQYLLSQVHMQSDTDGEDLCGLLKAH